MIFTWGIFKPLKVVHKIWLIARLRRDTGVVCRTHRSSSGCAYGIKDAQARVTELAKDFSVKFFKSRALPTSIFLFLSYFFHQLKKRPHFESGIKNTRESIFKANTLGSFSEQNALNWLKYDFSALGIIAEFVMVCYWLLNWA